MNIDITIQAISNGYLVHVSGMDKPFCYHTMASVQQALPNLIQMAANAEMLAKFKTQRESAVKHPHPTPDRHEDGKDIKGPDGDAINEALRVKMADAQKQKPTYAELREKLWAMAKAPTQLYSEQRDYGDETTAD